MKRDYKIIREIVGPLMLVDRVEGVTYDELVEVRTSDGSLRLGRVLEAQGDTALVQLFAGTQGLELTGTKARFLGHGLELTVSPEILGRVFDGLGRPIDGGGALISVPA